MRIFLLLAALLFGPMAWGYPAYSHPMPHRSLIYFAPTNDSHVKQFVLESLINECELEERDLVTLVVTADGFTSPAWMKEEFDLPALFDAYKVKPDSHTIILLGKDGGEKRRWDKKTDWELVKHIIDLMPMRQSEMATKVSPCSA
ncbi:DUF4174 domain-containing protein [Vibrio sp. Hep-1b-8]|uniref:DUF4174 domain-containing protein n=1 Tax=Vibrio sp. Hep-1b-8 TaxID=2144187 RepID=UPI001110467A|nr:DUF4174 domain-containing protein [Vibrio sp. Hep-1b-8]TMX31785.1 hypothetical protein DA100_18990 [Vibrio sp. Hep-1b-8]